MEEDRFDRFGHLNEFQHLSDPEITNPESADLGFKFILDDTDYPTLVLNVSVKRKPRDLVMLRYGLIRDRWNDLAQPDQRDKNELFNLARPQVSRDLQTIKGGDVPTSADSVKLL